MSFPLAGRSCLVLLCWTVLQAVASSCEVEEVVALVAKALPSFVVPAGW